MSSETTTHDIVRFLSTAEMLLSKGWCQGHFAKNFKDNPIKATSRAACKWCILGSLAHQLPPHAPIPDPVIDILHEHLPKKFKKPAIASIHLKKHSLTEFNDAQSDAQPVIDLVSRSLDSMLKKGV